MGDGLLTAIQVTHSIIFNNYFLRMFIEGLESPSYQVWVFQPIECQGKALTLAWSLPGTAGVAAVESYPGAVHCLLHPQQVNHPH